MNVIKGTEIQIKMFDDRLVFIVSVSSNGWEQSVTTEVDGKAHGHFAYTCLRQGRGQGKEYDIWVAERHCIASSAQSHCNYCLITLQLLPNNKVSIAQSHCNYCPITLQLANTCTPIGQYLLIRAQMPPSTHIVVNALSIYTYFASQPSKTYLAKMPARLH